MSDALNGGTADDQVRDGAQAQTGTDSSADANASTSVETLQAENVQLRAVNAQALAEKTTLENLKRENAELRARGPVPPMAGAAGIQDPSVGLYQRLQEHAAAFAADPANARDSGLVVALSAQNQTLAQQVQELRSLVVTPEQQKVMDLQHEYAGRGEKISAATARLLLSASQPAEPVVPADPVGRERVQVATRTVGVSASELASKTMTIADHTARTNGMTPSEKRAFDAKLEKDGTVVWG